MSIKEKYVKDELCKYEGIYKLYTQIKDEYIEKINKQEIDLSIEKIRLETILGKYNNPITNIYMGYFVSIVAVIITILLEQLGIFSIDIESRLPFLPQGTNISLKLLTAFFYMYVLMRVLNGKKERKDNSQYLVNCIRLKIIEDIELELKEKQLIEVAITKESNDYTIIKEIDDIKKFLGI